MENKVALQHLAFSDNLKLERDIQVMKQLEDMKDQTAYMKEFRNALGSALDEVKVLRTELAQEKSKGFEVLQESQRPNYLQQSCRQLEKYVIHSSQQQLVVKKELPSTSFRCKYFLCNGITFLIQLYYTKATVTTFCCAKESMKLYFVYF